MPAIDFYFDFTSPYGYLASQKIEALAAKHGRSVTWRPYLLGAAFKVNGSRPPTEVPLKSDYVKRDFPRSARFHGVAYRHPSVFPVAAVAATRAFYWAAAQDPKKAVDLAKAIYKAYFTEDVNIADAENVVKIAAAAGYPAEAVRAALNDQGVKEGVRRGARSRHGIGFRHRLPVGAGPGSGQHRPPHRFRRTCPPAPDHRWRRERSA
jgi:2-hydroxychromene-2-carboxylate isomerase